MSTQKETTNKDNNKEVITKDNNKEVITKDNNKEETNKLTPQQIQALKIQQQINELKKQKEQILAAQQKQQQQRLIISNPQGNSCWWWSSVRIILAYVKHIGIPKELSNDIIKKLIETKTLDIKSYDELTKKQGDTTNFLTGNAVEFLTVNGFYYSICIPVRRYNNSIALIQFGKIIPFALLIQMPGHFMSVVQEDDGFYLYNQVGNNLSKNKLNYDKEKQILAVPVCQIYTNIYLYQIGEPDRLPGDERPTEQTTKEDNKEQTNKGDNKEQTNKGDNKEVITK